VFHQLQNKCKHVTKKAFDEEIESFKQELAERLDDYLTYVTEEFMNRKQISY
jgi:hypothetical protein